MDFVAGKFLNHRGTERGESGEILYFVRELNERGGFVRNSQIEAWSVRQLADAITAKLEEKHDTSWRISNSPPLPNSEIKPLDGSELIELLDFLPNN